LHRCTTRNTGCAHTLAGRSRRELERIGAHQRDDMLQPGQIRAAAVTIRIVYPNLLLLRCVQSTCSKLYKFFNPDV
jgi:hypothetical protein